MLKKIFTVVIFISNFYIFSQEISPAEPKISVNYRGTRVSDENIDEFEIISSKIEKINDDKIQIDFEFNQGINPHSINKQKILLNGEIISSDAEFIFSRDGKTMRIIIPYKKENILIEIDELCSYDGKMLDSVEVSVN